MGIGTGKTISSQEGNKILKVGVILRLDRRIYRATGSVDPVVALCLPQDDNNLNKSAIDYTLFF